MEVVFDVRVTGSPEVTLTPATKGGVGIDMRLGGVRVMVCDILAKATPEKAKSPAAAVSWNNPFCKGK
jgi:hypothetical protein